MLLDLSEKRISVFTVLYIPGFTPDFLYSQINRSLSGHAGTGVTSHTLLNKITTY